MLRRCLGSVAVTAQAVGTVGLTLTAVFNIPEAMRSSGSATWISYGLALVVVLLVGETLVLFRQLPGSPNGIAGYVGAGLGSRIGAVASGALLLGYLLGALGCLELAQRDVQLSTRTMLVSECLSALIILSLTAAVVWKGWGAADLAAINPLRDTPAEVRSGLMVAVLSFIGFESAANLGREALQPERAIPRSIRTPVLLQPGLLGAE
jgi:amino acid transporter